MRAGKYKSRRLFLKNQTWVSAPASGLQAADGQVGRAISGGSQVETRFGCHRPPDDLHPAVGQLRPEQTLVRNLRATFRSNISHLNIVRQLWDVVAGSKELHITRRPLERSWLCWPPGLLSWSWLLFLKVNVGLHIILPQVRGRCS